MGLPKAVRAVAQRVVSWAGYQLIRTESLADLRLSQQNQKRLIRAMPFIVAMPPRHAARIAELLPRSTAQLCQDLFVLCGCDFKREGFFVEFGATDGLILSNSYLLESEFGWKGILAEPARQWQSSLKANRSAIIDHGCVWSTTGQSLEFNETQEGEYSTIDQFTASDVHRETRSRGTRYRVPTISLEDLLAKHNAPQNIDYLSIDTEGSEFEILAAFNFDRYRIDTITVEHNYTANRDRIHTLLVGHGYVRVHEEWSDFDDWYVRNDRS